MALADAAVKSACALDPRAAVEAIFDRERSLDEYERALFG